MTRPQRVRGCCRPARAPLAIVRSTLARAIVRVGHQPVGGRGLDQAASNLGAVELTAGDELMQREARAVERVIA